MYIGHIILKMRQFQAREPWMPENMKYREKLVLAFLNTEKGLEIQWFAFVFYFMTFIKSQILLMSSNSIFSQGLIYFCFYSGCSSKRWVARRDSEEGLYCSSSCAFYYLHFRIDKEKTLCGMAPICFLYTHLYMLFKYMS